MIPDRSRIEVPSLVDRCARDRGSGVLGGRREDVDAPGKIVTEPMDVLF